MTFGRHTPGFCYTDFRTGVSDDGCRHKIIFVVVVSETDRFRTKVLPAGEGGALLLRPSGLLSPGAKR